MSAFWFRFQTRVRSAACGLRAPTRRGKHRGLGGGGRRRTAAGALQLDLVLTRKTQGDVAFPLHHVDHYDEQEEKGYLFSSGPQKRPEKVLETSAGRGAGRHGNEGRGRAEGVYFAPDNEF